MEDKLPQQSHSHEPSSFMPDMTDTPPRADVDEILRRKRKAREYKVRNHARARRRAWARRGKELERDLTPEIAALGYGIRCHGEYSWTSVATPR